MSKAKLDGLGYGMEFAGPLGGVQRIQAQNRAAGSTLTLAPMDMNLALLMTLAQPAVKGVLTNTPPGSPSTGDAYVVGTSPTGAWVGFNNQVTIWDGTAWQFSGTAKTGWSVRDASVSTTPEYRFNGSAWSNLISLPGGINFGQQDLANYSTGTWTPTMGGSTAFGTQTYSTQAGRYTRIGRMVFITCRVTLASTSGATGTIIVGGLPFASSSSLTSRTGVANAQPLNITGFTTTLKASGSYFPAGASYITLADETLTGIPTSALTSSSFIDITAFYEV